MGTLGSHRIQVQFVALRGYRMRVDIARQTRRRKIPHLVRADRFIDARALLGGASGLSLDIAHRRVIRVIRVIRLIRVLFGYRSGQDLRCAIRDENVIFDAHAE